MTLNLDQHDPGHRSPLGTDIVIVVDLGGTQLRTAVFDLTGTMLTRRSILTPKLAGQAAIIATMIDQIRQAAAKNGRPVLMVGVSALGPVDPTTGVVRSAPTLHDFNDVPLGAALHAALQVPVHIVNDANAATIAEWRLGAGRGTHNFCYITVSTGIGSGIITNGQLLAGHAGYAGEFGRLRVPINRTGQTARLEEISSGTGIATAARTALARGAASTLRAVPHPAEVTAADVAAAAQAGDHLAQTIFTAAAQTLGLQIANLTRLIEPEVIAIGGSVTLAGNTFWQPLRDAVETSLNQDSIPAPSIRTAELAGDAGLHGAALALLDHHH